MCPVWCSRLAQHLQPGPAWPSTLLLLPTGSSWQPSGGWNLLLAHGMGPLPQCPIMSGGVKHVNILTDSRQLHCIAVLLVCCLSWTFRLRNPKGRKGWEPKILIRRIGLSKKSMIDFGFVISEIGLKSQNLQVRNNKKLMHFFKCFLFPIYSCDTFYTFDNGSCIFQCGKDPSWI